MNEYPVYDDTDMTNEEFNELMNEGEPADILYEPELENDCAE